MTVCLIALTEAVSRCHVCQTKAPNSPQITLNVTRSPHLCFTSVTQSPNLSQFCSKAGCFVLMPILRQVHRMTPKMALNTKRSKVPHIDMVTIADSEISTLLALRTAFFFQVTGHFKTCAMIPK